MTYNLINLFHLNFTLVQSLVYSKKSKLVTISKKCLTNDLRLQFSIKIY